jgi:hypothetical protein
VLVGGGELIQTLDARRIPREVAGLVLVDAFAEGAKTGLTGEQWASDERMMVHPPPELARSAASRQWTSARASPR